MIKIIRYLFAVTLVILLGLCILLYNDERSLRLRSQDLANRFSAPAASSLMLRNKGTVADDGGKVQVLDQTSMQKNVNRNETHNPDKSKARKTDKVNVTKHVKNMTLVKTKQSGDRKIKPTGNVKVATQQGNNQNRIAISSSIGYATVFDETNMKQKIPPKNFNKDSPFYGMLFRDEYGLPLRNRPQVVNYEQSKIEWHSWKSYFPDLMVNFQKLDRFNPTSNKTMSTCFSLVTFNRTSYKFGDDFQATITSQNGKRRPKQYGGDYYRARLINKNSFLPSDGIPCKIVDNYDGTYTATAPLLLEGRLVLDVPLVNPVEAIRKIVMKTEQLISWDKRYEATLESGEVVTCNVQLASNRQENRLNEFFQN